MKTGAQLSLYIYIYIYIERERERNRLIDCLMLTAGQPIKDYLMPIGLGIAFIVDVYLHFGVLVSFFMPVIWYQVFLSNSNNLHTVA